MNTPALLTAVCTATVAALIVGAANSSGRRTVFAAEPSPGATPIPIVAITGRRAAIHRRGEARFSDLPSRERSSLRHFRSIPRRVPNFTQSLQALAGIGAAPDLGLAPLATIQQAAGAVSTTFAGIDEINSDCNCEPPDTQVAGGPSDVVEVVNIAMNVFDKSGGLLMAKSLNDLYGIGGNFSTDPRIRYDTQSGRWFISMLSLDNSGTGNSHNGYFNLAVSDTSDPTGNYFIYQYETPGSLGDQPGLGISNDKVAIAGNAFSCNPDCNADIFLGNEVLVIDKSDLVNAAASPRADFYAPALDSNTFTILPAHEIAATGAALPGTLYMASVQYPSAGSVVVFQVTGTPSGTDTPGTSISKTSLSIHTLDSPPQALQLGSEPGHTPSYLIDSGDNRLQDAEWRDSALWVSADSSCTPPGDTTARSCLRYIEILTGSSPMTVQQDFDFGTASFYYYYPSIAIDQSDNMISAFSGSSSETHPSAYVSSQLTTDPRNSLQTPAEIAPGAELYDGTRWGDYSGAGIDPSDQSVAWVAAENSVFGSSPNWGTQIAAVNASAAPTPTATPTPTPGKLALSARKARFGLVRIGKAPTRKITLRNADHGTVLVTVGNTLTAPFASPQAGQTLTLAAHQRATITIQFTPTAAGPQSQTLTLTSNDPRKLSVPIAVFGKGRSVRVRAAGASESTY